MSANFNNQKLAVVGLGKLGLTFSACLADRGFAVTGVDINQDRVDAVNARTVGDVEPGLLELLKKSETLTATTSLNQAVRDNDVVFIFVNTPGEESGKFTTKDVLSVSRAVGEEIKSSGASPLIVLTSSVTPGSIEQEIIPALEEASGKKNGQGFDFCYSPVFIALGTMVRDYMNPDMALIGEASVEAGQRLEKVLQQLYTKEDVSVVHTNYINAELIKLCLSTFITTKITYANMLAALCDELSGADADTVAHAIGLDTRVSPKVLKGGMPYGGPCFPRDNRALLYVLNSVGVSGQLVTATDSFNADLLNVFAEKLTGLAGENGVIGVLGLAFKPETHVTEESSAVELVNLLAQRGRSVVVYDPEAMESAKEQLHPSVQFASSDIECVAKSSVTILATPWKEFADLPERLRGLSVSGKAIFDPWRTYDINAFPTDISYIPWGDSNVQENVLEENTV